jgi:hypothetical protein
MTLAGLQYIHHRARPYWLYRGDLDVASFALERALTSVALVANVNWRRPRQQSATLSSAADDRPRENAAKADLLCALTCTAPGLLISRSELQP